MCPWPRVDFPYRFKKAAVTPVIRKLYLHTENLKNYLDCHPVSGLGFMSTLVEGVVAEQFNNYINSNQLDNPLQVAYKSGQ